MTGYPNPFYDALNIEIELTNESNQPILEIYDINGKKIKILQPSNQSDKKYYYRWDGDNTLSSGVFLLNAQSGKNSSEKSNLYKVKKGSPL
jgi:flagellar hook assembly protein FlgD